ncbi:hypothetical protein TeGR_g4560 [Tetraparma gracilis]|uniref:Uncharacterized protein n=1 Tax=Tetraparma gracilis TaxID=2962635 RepID=A0ABQ6MPU3_9STRA|nr:hypothetical protein TeGR_g4560 [Tetraparma gracilis]
MAGGNQNNTLVFGRGNNGSQAPRWCCPAIFILAGIGCLIAGAVIWPQGAADLKAVQALDPEKEFSFLGETACAITEIAERCEDRNVCVREETYTTTRNGKSETETRCAEWGPEAWDLYTFSFEISGKAGVYLGTTEELRRYSNPSACDANQAKQLPTYGLSEEIPCWQPAGGIVVADIPSMYNCRNDACVKMVDPATEAANAEDTAKNKIMLGQILVGSGFGGFLLAAMGWYC